MINGQNIPGRREELPAWALLWWNVNNLLLTEVARLDPIRQVLENVQRALIPEVPILLYGFAELSVEAFAALADSLAVKPEHRLFGLLKNGGPISLGTFWRAPAEVPEKAVLPYRTDLPRARQRPLLKLSLRFAEGPAITVFLVHWIAQSGQAPYVDAVRLGQARDLEIEIAAAREGAEVPLIVCGDFNVNPYHDSVWHTLRATRDRRLVCSPRAPTPRLFNPAWPLLNVNTQAVCLHPGGPELVTSCRFASEWMAYEQILVSQWLVSDEEAGIDWQLDKFYVVNDAALLTASGLIQEVDHGRLSDHLPVLATFQRRSLAESA